jgi:exonuclease VII small subunit
MSAALQSVLAPVAESKSSIEGAFLRVGDGLGRGLEIFDQLNGSLSSLSQELSGGSVATATASLAALSRELVSVSEHLPQDSATLKELVESNAQVSVRLVRLIDNMRMMGILARSARIEAVVFDSKGSEYVDFTQEITTLTRRVQGEIETCSREHTKLSTVLASAAKAQLTLERDYRDRLTELAGELSEAFGTIQSRRERGAALMQDVAARASRISQAAGAAIMSLQAGDSTRQRLEHVHDAMAMVLDAAGPEAQATTAVMCRLQEAQLLDTVESFDTDIASIDNALQLLANDTRELVGLGQSVFGDAGSGSDSFLASFRARLKDATQLIQTCEEARHSLERIVAELRRMLDGLTEAVGHLNEVIMEIVLIGVNAGLKAGRLGTEGRSLVVIAHELKALAARISTDGKDLLPLFDTLQGISRQLDRDSADDGGAVDIDAAMTATMAELEQGGAHLNECLRALESGGRTFEAELERARREFTQMGAMNRALRKVAGTLEAEADPVADDIAGLRTVDALMAGRYTMAREREIHAAIIGQVANDDVPQAAPAAEEDDLAAILF